MHKQMIDGSIPSRESRRKGKNRVTKPISRHTLRFRALFAFDSDKGCRVIVGHSPPVRVK